MKVNFKNFSTSKKVFFCLFVIYAILVIVVGIIIKDPWFLLMFFYSIMMAVDVVLHQLNDDLVDAYSKALDGDEKNFLIISAIIKNNDAEELKNLAKIIDEIYGGENIED